MLSRARGYASSVVASITAKDVLARLPEEERRWIEEFRDRLRDEYGTRLRDLRLIGSKARGEWHEESDIDLLVLLDGCNFETQMAIIDAAMSISTRLHTHTFDFERYDDPVSRATGFYKEVRKESVRL